MTVPSKPQNTAQQRADHARKRDAEIRQAYRRGTIRSWIRARAEHYRQPTRQ